MGNLMEEFSKEFTITVNQLDCYDNLKPSTILDLSQVIASNHADKLDVGYESFIKNDLIWVVVRNYFEVLKPINNPDLLKVRTFPLKNRMIEYPRDYEFYYKDELVMKGRSIWMIFDLSSKEVIGKEFHQLNNEGNGVFEKRIRKLPLLKVDKDDFVKDVIVSQSYLDHNMHLNNTRSLDFYYDVFRPKKDQKIKNFQIEYVKQCYLDDMLSLFKKSVDSKNYLFAYKNEELMFYMAVEYF